MSTTAWTPLALALGALLTAAARITTTTGPDWLSGGLWTAGAILLGVWLERVRGLVGP